MKLFNTIRTVLNQKQEIAELKLQLDLMHDHVIELQNQVNNADSLESRIDDLESNHETMDMRIFDLDENTDTELSDRVDSLETIFHQIGKICR